MTTIVRDFEPILDLDLYGEHMPKERTTGSKIDLICQVDLYTSIYGTYTYLIIACSGICCGIFFSLLSSFIAA